MLYIFSTVDVISNQSHRMFNTYALPGVAVLVGLISGFIPYVGM